VGRLSVRGSISEMKKKASINYSPVQGIKLSGSSLNEIEEQSKKNDLGIHITKTRFKRRNINDILSDFIDKINEVYFANFVESTMAEANKVEKDVFLKMKDAYLKYWNEKFQLDMVLVEIGDESMC
jgi:hypothetical protein